MAAEQTVRFRMNVNDENADLRGMMHEPQGLVNCPIELEMTCFHCTKCGTYTEFSKIPPEIALTCENVLKWHRENSTNSICKKKSVSTPDMELVFFDCECRRLNGIRIPVSSKPCEKSYFPPVKCHCGIGYSAHIQTVGKGSAHDQLAIISHYGNEIGCVAAKKIISPGQDIHRDTFWTSRCPSCVCQGPRSYIINYYGGRGRCVGCRKNYILTYNREKEIFEIDSV